MTSFLPSARPSFDDLLRPRRLLHEATPKERNEALWDCIALATDFARLDLDTRARYLLNDPDPLRWHNITALSARERSELKERGVTLMVEAVKDIDRLLDQYAPTAFFPREYRVFSIGPEEHTLLDSVLSTPGCFESRYISSFMFLGELNSVWDTDVITFLWERLGSLLAAGCPPRDSAERARILTLPTKEEWEDQEAARKEREEAEIAGAGALCRKYAPLFASFSLHDQVECLCKHPNPERWALMTSCLTPERLRQVEQGAKEKEEEYLRGLGYLDERDARRRR